MARRPQSRPAGSAGRRWLRDGIGTFIGEDTFDGRPILVRFRWSGITDRAVRWEQAFSEDGGATWEVNWVMDLTRDG